MPRYCVRLLLYGLFGLTALCQTFTDGPAAAVNADGRIEIFARASDGSVWHNWQTSPGGSWNGWSSLGGWIAGSPTAIVNIDGRLDVFVVNGGNIVYHNYQTSPGGGWSGWIGLGAGNIVTPPTPAKNFDGRLQLFALGTDGSVWTAYQQIPGDDWSGWTSLGGYIAGAPSVAENADGRLEIFALGGGDGALYHNWQTSPGGGFSGWNWLLGNGNMATAPTVGVNDDGRLEVFTQGTDGTGWHVWQTSPGGGWSGGASLGGQISGSPTVELDSTTYLEAFAIAPGGAPYVDYEGNGWAGWNALGGQINAAPAIAMNFDGRLEIFGIGTDGQVWHNWQQSSGGPWSGWQPLGTPSNSETTNSADVPYFLTDAQNDQNYAAAQGNCTAPPWLSAANAWPCGARVNIGFTGYNKKSMTAFQKAVDNWNSNLYSYYVGKYGAVPVQLFVSSGGPQTAHVYSVCNICIPGSKPNTYGRARNYNQATDPDVRLLSLDIQIIRGMTYSKTLTNTLAHELGHTFGLNDCSQCGPTTVMDVDEPAPNGHVWPDYVSMNFTQGLPGPTNCDQGVVDSHLGDYHYCGMVADSPPPDQPTCTNGTAVAFTDSGGPSSSYNCGQPCDGCNSYCSNFAPQKCPGNSGSGSCPDTASCDDFSPGVFATDYCQYPQGGCPDGYYSENYCCYNGTPIIVDAFKEGFHLTNLRNGVNFRVHPNQSLYQVSWTDPQWHNGWLVLDRNGNGTIDDFTEMFGNFTPQPPSGTPNGYVALAVFDNPMNGGNGNGTIDPGDSVYDSLRVWIDANHNGVSEPDELHTLREIGIFRIDLTYTLSQYADTNGNHFRYQAKIWDGAGGSHNACYDVVLQFSLKGKN